MAERTVECKSQSLRPRPDQPVFPVKTEKTSLQSQFADGLSRASAPSAEDVARELRAKKGTAITGARAYQASLNFGGSSPDTTKGVTTTVDSTSGAEKQHQQQHRETKMQADGSSTASAWTQYVHQQVQDPLPHLGIPAEASVPFQHHAPEARLHQSWSNTTAVTPHEMQARYAGVATLSADGAHQHDQHSTTQLRSSYTAGFGAGVRGTGAPAGPAFGGAGYTHAGSQIAVCNHVSAPVEPTAAAPMTDYELMSSTVTMPFGASGAVTAAASPVAFAAFDAVVAPRHPHTGPPGEPSGGFPGMGRSPAARGPAMHKRHGPLARQMSEVTSARNLAYNNAAPLQRQHTRPAGPAAPYGGYSNASYNSPSYNINMHHVVTAEPGAIGRSSGYNSYRQQSSGTTQSAGMGPPEQHYAGPSGDATSPGPIPQAHPMVPPPLQKHAPPPPPPNKKKAEKVDQEAAAGASSESPVHRRKPNNPAAAPRATAARKATLSGVSAHAEGTTGNQALLPTSKPGVLASATATGTRRPDSNSPISAAEVIAASAISREEKEKLDRSKIERLRRLRGHLPKGTIVSEDDDESVLQMAGGGGITAGVGRSSTAKCSSAQAAKSSAPLVHCGRGTLARATATGDDCFVGTTVLSQSVDESVLKTALNRSTTAQQGPAGQQPPAMRGSLDNMKSLMKAKGAMYAEPSPLDLKIAQSQDPRMLKLREQLRKSTDPSLLGLKEHMQVMDRSLGIKIQPERKDYTKLENERSALYNKGRICSSGGLHAGKSTTLSGGNNKHGKASKAPASAASNNLQRHRSAASADADQNTSRESSAKRSSVKESGRTSASSSGRSDAGGGGSSSDAGSSPGLRTTGLSAGKVNKPEGATSKRNTVMKPSFAPGPRSSNVSATSTACSSSPGAEMKLQVEKSLPSSDDAHKNSSSPATSAASSVEENSKHILHWEGCADVSECEFLLDAAPEASSKDVRRIVEERSDTASPTANPRLISISSAKDCETSVAANVELQSTASCKNNPALQHFRPMWEEHADAVILGDDADPVPDAVIALKENTSGNDFHELQFRIVSPPPMSQKQIGNPVGEFQLQGLNTEEDAAVEAARLAAVKSTIVGLLAKATSVVAEQVLYRENTDFLLDAATPALASNRKSVSPNAESAGGGGDDDEEVSGDGSCEREDQAAREQEQHPTSDGLHAAVHAQPESARQTDFISSSSRAKADSKSTRSGKWKPPTASLEDVNAVFRSRGLGAVASTSTTIAPTRSGPQSSETVGALESLTAALSEVRIMDHAYPTTAADAGTAGAAIRHSTSGNEDPRAGENGSRHECKRGGAAAGAAGPGAAAGLDKLHRYTGMLKRYSTEHGKGFLRVREIYNETGRDVYVRLADLPGAGTYRCYVGQAFELNVVYDRNRQPRAANVTAKATLPQIQQPAGKKVVNLWMGTRRKGSFACDSDEDSNSSTDGSKPSAEQQYNDRRLAAAVHPHAFFHPETRGGNPAAGPPPSYGGAPAQHERGTSHPVAYNVNGVAPSAHPRYNNHATTPYRNGGAPTAAAQHLSGGGSSRHHVGVHQVAAARAAPGQHGFVAGTHGVAVADMGYPYHCGGAAVGAGHGTENDRYSYTAAVGAPPTYTAGPGPNSAWGTRTTPSVAISGGAYNHHDRLPPPPTGAGWLGGENQGGDSTRAHASFDPTDHQLRSV